MPGSLLPTPNLQSTKHTWRKVQGDLYTNATVFGKREEPKFLATLKKASEAWSAYEVTYTLDLNERAGAARVPDMGYLAQTRSVDTVEATIYAFHSNARFAISNQSQWADEGNTNQIISDFKARSMQSMDAMVEQDSDYFWGASNGVLATTDTDISGTSTAALQLANAFGQTSITNLRYVADLFRVGDWIALIAAGSDTLIDANAIGQITSKNEAAGQLAVTWQGSVSSYTTNGIRIVKANNLERTTVAGGTDLNQGYAGITEIMFNTSVAGVSGATYSYWNPSTADTSSVRFTPTHLKLAKHNTKNRTGLTPDTWLVAQGVDRDMDLQQSAGLRYESASYTYDGDTQATGFKKWTMRKTPPGMVFVGAKEGINNWEILPLEGTKSKSGLKAYIDQAASVGDWNKFGNIVTRSRAAWGYFTNKTES